MKQLYSSLFFLLALSKVNADPCTASFSASVEGYTIHLDGSASTGDVAHWAWYINGDLFSDDGPLTSIITDTGTFEICLVTITASACTDTICENVTVEQQPGDCLACFTYSVDGFTINLNGSCSTGDVTHWLWYINGDLFSDAGPETHHLVNDTGTYELCLIISTASGCIDTVCQEVHVEQQQGDCEGCFTFSVSDFTINLNGSCSTGDVTHWLWYINGDLFSDAGPETHHLANDTGTYELCLIISTASGCIDTVCHEVHVEQQQSDCEACFTYSVSDLTISLNSSCSTGDVGQWLWYINGDLFSDAGPETYHVVSSAGTYVVCLIITTASGCIDTVCQEIHVEQQQGDCEACFTYSVDGLTINLNGSCSTGDVTHWMWYINGDLFSDDGPETHFVVSNTGTYELCLIITTASGCIDTVCQEVHVEQQQGDCEACFTYWLDGFTIHLNGACSTGDVAHWAWYINGDFFSDTGPETHHEVNVAGTYELCLIISTASGCIDTVCQEVHVEEQQGDCEACFTYSVNDFTISLNSSCSAGDVGQWLWYINGDLFSDAGPETHYVVNEAGTYVVCLIITTASGCVDTVCQEIHVEQQQSDCESCFTYWLDGFTIHLNGDCSTGDVVHWAWYINGDLFSDDGPETHHEVTDSGTYEVCLIIETANGCVDTIYHHIHVENFQDEDYEFRVVSSGSEGDVVIEVSSLQQGFFIISTYDITGRMQFEEKHDLPVGISQYTILNRQQLPPSCYFIRINFNDESTQTNKVMILK